MLRAQERDLILIVEDDQDVAEMLCTYLRTKQYRLAVAGAGSEVLPLCERERPRVVLLDINLPDTDGFQVCRQLRDNLATSTIPIIFMTQRTERESRIAGLEEGGNDYIVKPFDMEELYLRVSNAARRSRHQAGIDGVSALPAGPLVEAQLKGLLNRADWAVLLITVEGFGSFESAYRHLVPRFAAYVAQMVRHSVDRVGNHDDFVGTVGTVEYLVITTEPRIEPLKTQLEQAFRRAMDPPDGGNGHRPVTAHLSLAFGAITDRDGPYGDVRSLAESVTEARRCASPVKRATSNDSSTRGC